MARAAVPILLEAIHHSDAAIRADVVEALGGFCGEDAREAIPDLVAALHDSDETVRIASAEALGGFDQDAVEAIPALGVLLESGSVAERKAAVDALGFIGGAASYPYLIRVLTGGDDQSVRATAAGALGMALSEGLDHSSEAARADAEAALAALGEALR